MLVATLIILLVMLTLSVGTLLAFSWAASNRQFEDLQNGAEVIFDPDEPIGDPTDPEIRRNRNE